MIFAQPVFLVRAKTSVCWDPLQTLGLQGEPKPVPFILTADSLRAVHSAAGTERSHSFPNPDKFGILFELVYSRVKCIDGLSLGIHHRRYKYCFMGFRYAIGVQ